MTKTKYWVSILAVSVVLLAGSIAVGPIAIADPEGEDDPEDPGDPGPEDPVMEETKCEECDRKRDEGMQENIEKFAKCVIDAEADPDKLGECDLKYGPPGVGEERSKVAAEWLECVTIKNTCPSAP